MQWELDAQAIKLLQQLIPLFPTVEANDPRTFTNYKAIHTALGLLSRAAPDHPSLP